AVRSTFSEARLSFCRARLFFTRHRLLLSSARHEKCRARINRSQADVRRERRRTISKDKQKHAADARRNAVRRGRRGPNRLTTAASNGRRTHPARECTVTGRVEGFSTSARRVCGEWVARPEGLEPPAYRFEACRSIQLSYGRARDHRV